MPFIHGCLFHKQFLLKFFVIYILFNIMDNISRCVFLILATELNSSFIGNQLAYVVSYAFCLLFGFFLFRFKLFNFCPYIICCVFK
ncbi:Uncharacterised protein [Mycobacteroides abscessus subsp. abscessus]|nr:Uncharacterised protein [Mycobacteroides abscessus subsp. abscessus]